MITDTGDVLGLCVIMFWVEAKGQNLEERGANDAVMYSGNSDFEVIRMGEVDFW